MTVTATSDPDDNRVWAVDLAAQRLRNSTTTRLGAEYAFDPQTSLQIRTARSAAPFGLRVEFKRLFNNCMRDDWS